jgi:signal transduction histidine kinase
MKRSVLVNPYFFLSILLVLGVGYFAATRYFIHQNAREVIADKFRKAFVKNEHILKELSDKLLYFDLNDTLYYWNKADELFEKKDYLCFVFLHNKPVYWNNNEIFIQEFLGRNNKSKGVLHQGLGWYQYHYVKNRSGKAVIILIKIIKDIPVANKYLHRYYNKDYLPSVSIDLSQDKDNADVVIEHPDGTFLVGLSFKEHQLINRKAEDILSTIVLLFFVFLPFFLISLLYKISFINKSKHLKAVASLLVIFLSYSLFDLLLPFDLLKGSFLFESWSPVPLIINGRGGALLFSFYLLIIAYIIFQLYYINDFRINKLQFILISITEFLVLLGLVTIFRMFYLHTLKVDDVTTGFLFRHDLIELIFIGAVVISVFGLLLTYVRVIRDFPSYPIWNFIVVILGSLALYLIFNKIDLYALVSIVVLQSLFLVVIFYTPVKQDVAFLRYLLLLVLFALSFMIVINNTYLEFKNQNQKNVVNILVKEFDEELENNFLSIKNKISHDKELLKMFADSVPDEIVINYITKKFVDGRIKQYDIQITICRNEDYLQLTPDGNVISCNDFFNSIKQDHIKVNQDSTLYMLDYESENTYYLGEVDFNDSLFVGKIFFEFFSSVIPADLGYPEILRDENKVINLSGFNIAKYSNHELIYQYGDYDYHSGVDYLNTIPDSSFYLQNGYVHYKVTLTDDKVLIVSRKAFTFTERMATFSVLFVLFTFLSVFIYGVYYGKTMLLYLKYSFRARLQIFFISTLLTLFIMLAGITVYYFLNTRKVVTINQLNEKTKSVLMEIPFNYGGKDIIKSDKKYLEEILKELSMVFFTDINIYNRHGELVATSSPKIFERGLLSPIINPEGFKKIILENKLFFLNTERIGNLEYYSSYVPLSYNGNDVSGILNLPYFAKQSSIKNSFFIILFNYLNLFVLVGIIGTLIAIFVSRMLTKPLSMLQHRLAETRLDKKNEPLEWSHNDEIGQLIAEYNKMVKKLEESAELLKRSERESAWREIAQQIAHEIRNPLTPMKLNVQYLQRCYKTDEKKFDEKFSTLTTSIITQIEALNDVASMFTDLSRSGAGEPEKIDVLPLLKSSVLLYNNTSGIEVTLETSLQKAWVFAREPELLRVFNNIIKNAVQATETGEGKVVVELKEDDEGFIIIKIKDSGKGISEEMKQKIFLPYFTTKTGGTGIGLAIVKNIINEIGGTIHFESERGEGTVFIIKLKKA